MKKRTLQNGMRENTGNWKEKTASIRLASRPPAFLNSCAGTTAILWTFLAFLIMNDSLCIIFVLKDAMCIIR